VNLATEGCCASQRSCVGLLSHGLVLTVSFVLTPISPAVVSLSEMETQNKKIDMYRVLHLQTHREHVANNAREHKLMNRVRERIAHQIAYDKHFVTRNYLETFLENICIIHYSRQQQFLIPTHLLVTC
jgi:hypothetical protein